MTSWICLPEAARLLASCAGSPPRCRLAVYRFKETELRFVGRRVRRLVRLYRAAQPPLDSADWRKWLRLDPQEAIRQAIGRHCAAAAGKARPGGASAVPGKATKLFNCATKRPLRGMDRIEKG